MDDKTLWSKVLDNIGNIVDPLSYETWFKNIDFLGLPEEFESSWGAGKT